MEKKKDLKKQFIEFFVTEILLLGSFACFFAAGLFGFFYLTGIIFIESISLAMSLMLWMCSLIMAQIGLRFKLR